MGNNAATAYRGHSIGVIAYNINVIMDDII